MTGPTTTTDTDSERGTPTRTKLCFVTVGATAPFNELITAILSVPFLLELASNNYTHLRIQHGHGGDTTFTRSLNGVKESYKFLKRGGKDSLAAVPGNIQISGFDLAVDADMLRAEMSATQADATTGAAEGLFISHAGTGSLLDGLTFGVPMILVPNPSLADNHQEELAVRFDKMHYAVKGDVNDLPSAIQKAEDWRREMMKPIRYQWEDEQTQRRERKKRKKEEQRTLQDVMDQEMGYVQVE
jgi:beta-1,4-N-acetylglucosaminyltransferase